MSCTLLRSGKNLPSLDCGKQLGEDKPPKETKKSTPKHEDAMTAEVLLELKSMRNNLTGQMKKLSADLTNFQRDINARLAKIENVMLKIDEIDNLNKRAHKLEENVGRMKVSLTKINSTVEAVGINTEASLKPLQESNRELKNKLEHLERFSRDFNIRLIRVEEDGEDCMAIVLDYFKILGFEYAYGELENAHRTGKRREDKARHIIAKLYSRPFKRNLLPAAKSPEKKDMLNGVRIVEDFSPSDFDCERRHCQK